MCVCEGVVDWKNRDATVIALEKYNLELLFDYYRWNVIVLLFLIVEKKWDLE